MEQIIATMQKIETKSVAQRIRGLQAAQLEMEHVSNVPIDAIDQACDAVLRVLSNSTNAELIQCVHSLIQSIGVLHPLRFNTWLFQRLSSPQSKEKESEE